MLDLYAYKHRAQHNNIIYDTLPHQGKESDHNRAFFSKSIHSSIIFIHNPVMADNGTKTQECQILNIYTRDNASGIKLSLPLICLISRLYS